MAQWEVYDPVSLDFGNSAVVLIIGVRICAYEEFQRFFFTHNSDTSLLSCTNKSFRLCAVQHSGTHLRHPEESCADRRNVQTSFSNAGSFSVYFVF